MKIYDFFCQNNKLNYIKFTFVFEIELTIAKKQSFNNHFPINHLNTASIFELKIVGPITESFHIIEPKIDFRLNLSMNSISSPLKEVSTHWRMMTDLF